MTEKKLPNLFLLLDLNPDAPWDQGLFEERLRDKRREWSGLTHMPSKRGLQAKQSLSKIPHLKRVAADEALRQQQASAARQEQKTSQAERLQVFEADLDLLAAKGHILEAELQRLVKDYADILSEVEIRKRLKVPLEKGRSARGKAQPALAAAKARGINRRLDNLGKTDLYDFLGMGKKPQGHLLRQRARERYDAVMRKAARSSQDTLISELSGYCLDIFKSEAGRAKYDETLRRQVFEDLKKKVDQAARVSKRLEAAQMEQLLREARENGLDLDETLEVLIGHARDRGYAILVSERTTSSVATLQRCGYCGQLVAPDKQHCTDCGQPLRESCPRCGQVGPTDQMACGQCGFPVGNRVWVEHLLGEADQASRQRDFQLALELLAQAQQAWPAEAKNPVGQRIEVLASQIEPARQAQEAMVQQIHDLIKQRHFYTARDLLPDLAQALPTSSPDLGGYERQIKTRIRQVEVKLAEARRSATVDPEIEVLAYQEVVRLCQDCQEARDMLAKTPPSSPQAVQTTLGGTVVHLNWQPSRSQNVRYTVVRKSSSRPVSVSDGQQLSTVAGTSYDDTDPEPGLPLFYAIFADREGVPSKTGATLSQPIMLIQDVGNLTSQVDDRRVHLQWQPPPNVHDVVVVRSELRYPHSLEEGQRIAVLGKEQAVDGQVQNEQRYYYTVFAQFKDYADQLVTTPGTRIEAVPQQPPRPIAELRIMASGRSHARRVQLDWNPPRKGKVIILKSDTSSGLTFGDTIPQQELSRYGQVLQTSGGQARDKAERAGIYFYLPVVCFQDMAYIGREQQYSCMDDIAELSVQNLGRQLRLEWRWPPNCQEVVVAYGHTDWPQPDGSQATTVALTKAQYDLRGYYDISNPVMEDHYIIVYAVITQAGQRIISTGQAEDCRRLVSLRSRIMLNYEIKKSRFQKKHHLQLTFQGKGTLPALVLVRKRATLPMKKTDGEIVLRSEPMSIKDDNLVLQIPQRALRGRSYVRLFLEDDNMYDFVTIRHPSREKLRLS